MASSLPTARRVRRSLVGCLLLSALLLSGCEYIASALPPSPSPFPTLARLPTVTPITPSPTFPPSPTPRPVPTPTITPVPILEGTVVVGANVRAGPSLDFAIVTSVVAETQVTLQGRSAEWYQVTLPDGTEGWMSEQVLAVPPETVPLVPEVEAAPQ